MLDIRVGTMRMVTACYKLVAAGFYLDNVVVRVAKLARPENPPGAYEGSSYLVWCSCDM